MKTKIYSENHLTVRMLLVICVITILTVPFIQSSKGQVNITIGSGVYTVSHPFNASPDFQGQYLYFASELIESGACAGNISQLGFDFKSLGENHTYLNMTIKMKLTSDAAVPAGLMNNDGFTTVLSGYDFTPAATGWNIIDLVTPFYWDGISNLYIMICRDATSTGNYSVINATSTSPVRTFKYYYANNTFSLCGAGSVYGPYSDRPNILLTQPSQPEPLGPASISLSNPLFSDIVINSTPINGNNVLIVYNTSGEFGTPSGVPPSAGNLFAGGTVAYCGTNFPATVGSFMPATTYYMRAWSYDGSSYSCASRTTKITTSYALNPPQSLKATSAVYNIVDLSWTKNAENNDVMVVYNTINTFGAPVQGTAYQAGENLPGGGTIVYVGSETSYAHTGRAQNTTYYYAAFSTSGAPNNYYSPILSSVTYNVRTPFASPKVTGFTAVPLLPAKIKISWDQNINPVLLVKSSTQNVERPVDGTIYSAGDPVTGGAQVIYNGTATSFLHTGLTSNTVYYYRIYSYTEDLLYSDSPNPYYHDPKTYADPVAFPYTCDFSSLLANNGWQSTHIAGSFEWQTKYFLGAFSGNNPFSGTHLAYVRNDPGLSPGNTRLLAPCIDLSTAVHPIMSLYYNKNSYQSSTEIEQNSSSNNYIQPQVSIDGGESWINLGQPLMRYDPSYPLTGEWIPVILDLEQYIGINNLLIGFLGVDEHQNSNSLGIDLVKIKEREAPICIPTAIPSHNAVNIDRNVELEWNHIPDADSYDIYFGTTNPPNYLTNTCNSYYRFPYLLNSNTQYFWKIVPRNAFSSASDCSIWSFTTNDMFNYCSSLAFSYWYGYEYFNPDIYNVTFNTINNFSPFAGDGQNCSDGYTDYTSISTDIAQGLTYPVSVTQKDCKNSGLFGWPLDAWYVAVYIDFNHNGQFDTPSEKAYTSPSIPKEMNTASGFITVPSTALPGPTRMRVIVNAYWFISSCGTYECGETEDYTVNIVPYNQDLAMISWDSPINSCGLSSSETVTIRYKNMANETQDNYQLSYFNGSNWITENVGVPIAPGETKSYTFSTTADFSLPGTYSCQAKVILTGDQKTDNDTTCLISLIHYPLLTASIPDVNVIGQGANANTIYIGYGPTSLTYTAIPGGGTAPYSYSWSDGSNTSSVTFSNAGTYIVTITDSYNCTAITSKTILVRDIRCGNQLQKVLVCRIPPGNSKPVTLCLPVNAVPIFLGNGSYLGPCGNNAKPGIPEGAPGSLLCYPNPFSDAQNIEYSSPVQGRVLLELYDLAGSRVKTLADEPVLANLTYIITLDAKTLEDGIYYVRFTSDSGVMVQRIALIK